MNKYHSTPCEVDGIRFDSQKEARRYSELKLLECAGEIKNLVVHPVYLLQGGFKHHGKYVRPITYEVDFGYTENGSHVVEDVKSEATKTALFRVKQKMFWFIFPDFELRIIE